MVGEGGKIERESDYREEILKGIEGKKNGGRLSERERTD